MSEFSSDVSRHSSNYICVDDAPDVPSGGVNQIQSVLYFVAIYCGSLPCSIYHSGWEMACVVCTK